MFEELISHCAYEPLTCTTRLALVGALDMGSVPRAESALADALVYYPHRIDLDLSRLTFCDSAGLHFLLDTSSRIMEREIELRLLDPQPQVQKLFALTGTKEAFTIIGEGVEA